MICFFSCFRFPVLKLDLFLAESNWKMPIQKGDFEDYFGGFYFVFCLFFGVGGCGGLYILWDYFGGYFAGYFMGVSLSFITLRSGRNIANVMKLISNLRFG